MHTYITKMDVLMKKIKDHLSEIARVKVAIHQTDHNKKFITWKMSRNNIYMYDCGENYATVYTLHSKEELLREIGRHVNSLTKEISIRYTNGNKEVIQWT